MDAYRNSSALFARLQRLEDETGELQRREARVATLERDLAALRRRLKRRAAVNAFELVACVAAALMAIAGAASFLHVC